MKKLFHILKKLVTLYFKIWLWFFLLSFVTLFILGKTDYLGYGYIAQGSTSIFEIGGKYVYLSGIEWLLLLSLILSVGAVVASLVAYLVISIVIGLISDFLYRPKKIEYEGVVYQVLKTHLYFFGILKMTIINTGKEEDFRVKVGEERISEKVKATRRLTEYTTLGKFYMYFLISVTTLFLTIIGLLLFRFKEIWTGEWYEENDLWQSLSEDINHVESFYNFTGDNVPIFLDNQQLKKYYSWKTRKYADKKFKENNNEEYYGGGLMTTLRLEHLGLLQSNPSWLKMHQAMLEQAEERRRDNETAL